MFITIKLFASHRTGRFRQKTLEYPADTQAGAVIEALEIPTDKLGIVLLNGQRAALHQPLQDGDTLALFPLVSGG